MRNTICLWLVLAVGGGLSVASAATFIVSTTADSGPGSLREAILQANASPGHDFIHFAIQPSNVVHVINLAAGLPPITETVTIDGLTQPGSAPNSLAQGFKRPTLSRSRAGTSPWTPARVVGVAQEMVGVASAGRVPQAAVAAPACPASATRFTASKSEPTWSPCGDCASWNSCPAAT